MSAPLPAGLAEVEREARELLASASWPSTPPQTKGVIERLLAALSSLRAYAAQVERWWKIEHAAWHMLDNGEERVDAEEIVFDSDDDDLRALSDLLPEDHPLSPFAPPPDTENRDHAESEQ